MKSQLQKLFNTYLPEEQFLVQSIGWHTSPLNAMLLFQFFGLSGMRYFIFTPSGFKPRPEIRFWATGEIEKSRFIRQKRLICRVLPDGSPDGMTIVKKSKKPMK